MVLEKPASKLENLLIKARAGDKDAENEIFRILTVRFRLFARQRVGDNEAADDISQKACVIILEKYRNENFTVGFDAWAYGVLKMGIRNYYHGIMQNRKKGQAIKSDPLTESATSVTINPDVEMKLLKCLEKIMTINSRYARVLNLAYQGYGADEICKKLRVSKNNYYVILNRARSLLWECLKEGS